MMEDLFAVDESLVRDITSRHECVDKPSNKPVIASLSAGQQENVHNSQKDHMHGSAFEHRHDPRNENEVNIAQAMSDIESDDAKDLGIETEVRVRRRQERAKLDAERLLRSDIGLPKLMAKAKSQLKFKGAGHEIEDMQRLVEFYQLWTHELFPKARYEDAWAMIQRLGHQAQVRTARMQWLNEARFPPADEELQKDSGESVDVEAEDVNFQQLLQEHEQEENLKQADEQGQAQEQDHTRENQEFRLEDDDDDKHRFNGEIREIKPIEYSDFDDI